MIEARLAELSPIKPVVVIENRARVASGEMRWMQFVNRAFFDADGRLRELQAVGRDIHERKQAEGRQRALFEENIRLGRELIRLQEKERADLAKELHDELSSQLVAIRAHAAAIKRRAGTTDKRSQEDVAAIDASATAIYSASHRLMEGLRPQVLDSAELGDVLRSLVTEWSSKYPATRATLRLATEASGAGSETKLHLFRIAQECLANVARHARARRVSVFLGERRREGCPWLRLVVCDDGVGMSTEAPPRTGYGLLVLRERARDMGGRLNVRSQPGQGVRVTVDVPLAAASPGRS
jgi:two-component system, NarL family, sensor histidine kinase UhpB